MKQIEFDLGLDPMPALTIAFAREVQETLAPLDFTRFRGHCSPWGEERVHDAEDTTALPPQLRARLIELARTGRTPEELGR